MTKKGFVEEVTFKHIFDTVLVLSILILETQKNYHWSNVLKYWPSGGEVFGAN